MIFLLSGYIWAWNWRRLRCGFWILFIWYIKIKKQKWNMKPSAHNNMAFHTHTSLKVSSKLVFPLICYSFVRLTVDSGKSHSLSSLSPISIKWCWIPLNWVELSWIWSESSAWIGVGNRTPSCINVCLYFLRLILNGIGRSACSCVLKWLFTTFWLPVRHKRIVKQILSTILHRTTPSV